MPQVPSRKKYSNLPTGKARKELGLALAEEMGRIVEKYGADHPDLTQHLSEYIKNLDDLHPEWSGYWDRGFASTRSKRQEK